MKLLCSILILAGVVALNDASISFEEQQMRLAKDTKMLEDLKRMALNRDANSLECSQDLVAALAGALENYNTALNTCNKTKDDEISAANVGLCLLQAYSDYRMVSERVNKEFTDCINGKPSNGGFTIINPIHGGHNWFPPPSNGFWPPQDNFEA